MRPIVVMSLLLALPGIAVAQPASQGPGSAGLPGTNQPDGPGRGGESAAPAEARGALLAPSVAAPTGAAPSGFPPAGQKPPRPEKAIGPDIASYIFAPIGGIVGPITEGLHAFDAAIAPINEALLPITGPYGTDLVVGPDGAPLPPEAGVAVAEPVSPAPPPARGPRK